MVANLVAQATKAAAGHCCQVVLPGQLAGQEAAGYVNSDVQAPAATAAGLDQGLDHRMM